MIIHSVVHWPEVTSLDLWPFAFEHAVLIWNHLPQKETGMAPIEIFAGSKIPKIANHLSGLTCGDVRLVS
jgi:hypothetical protein